MSDEIPTIIKDLAEAVSASVKVQNRHWLALAIASLFVLVPRTGSITVQLPLGLPEVPTESFALVAVLVLSVLTIAFCAAQSRSVRVANFAHRVMADRVGGAQLVSGHDERDYFDVMREPSLGQVASLAQVLEGQSHFRVDGRKSNLKILSQATYVLFKLPSLVIWLALPAGAEIYAVRRYHAVGAPSAIDALATPLVWFLAVFAGISLLIAAFLEVGYVVRVVRRSWNDDGAGSI